MIHKEAVIKGDAYNTIMKVPGQYDHERAKIAIEHDYWTPVAPLFNDQTFERTVCVIKQQSANTTIELTGALDPFLTDRDDALGKQEASSKVKIPMG